MTTLTPMLREKIWPESDWSQAIFEQANAVLESQSLQESKRSDHLEALASLCEFCSLEPKLAADLYSAAYSANKQKHYLLDKIRLLCVSMGEQEKAAKTAELAYKAGQDPRFLVIAGQSWLDAGEPNRALRLLLRAQSLAPDNPHLEAALEVARREWAEPEAEAERLASTGQKPRDISKHSLQAARIFRMLGIEDQRYENALHRVLEGQPNLPSACHLMEAHLLGLQRWSDLRSHFERRAKLHNLPKEGARIAFEGSALLFRHSRHQQAAPLLELGISLSKTSGAPESNALLALLKALIVSPSQERKKVGMWAEELYPLLESDDQKLGLSVFAAQITWQAQHDLEAAQSWMLRIAEIFPQHSVLEDFNLTRKPDANLTPQTLRTPPPPLPPAPSPAPADKPPSLSPLAIAPPGVNPGHKNNR